MSLTISTYNGDFHCDQVFACYLIRKLIGLDAKIIRTRDSTLIEKSDYVIGVGFVYDHSKSLYDYHQSDFKNTTLKSLDPRKPFNIKLSCAGLVYHHYGRIIIKQILNFSADLPLSSEFDDTEQIETLFDVIYENFVSEIDAIANDTSISEGKLTFRINSDITSRVSRLRPNWTDQISDDFHTERFMKAIDLVGSEFEEIVKYYGKVWFPAKIFVKQTIVNCKKVHSSGAIIDLSQSGGMPWIEHLITTERELNIEGQIKFAIFYDVSGIWRLSCVPQTFSLDEIRIPFHSDWHGLSYSAFCDITGIPDCIYIHPLISDFETRESCIAVAEKLIQLNSDRYLTLNKAHSISDGSFYSLTDQLSLEEIHFQSNGHEPTVNGNLNKDDCKDDEEGVSFNCYNQNENLKDDNINGGCGDGGDVDVKVLYSTKLSTDQDDIDFKLRRTDSYGEVDLTIDNQNIEISYQEDDEGDGGNNEDDYSHDEQELSGGDDYEYDEEYLRANEEGIEEEEEEEEEERDLEDEYDENLSEFTPVAQLITILEDGYHLYHIPPPSLPPAEYHLCVVSALVDPNEFYIHLSNDDSAQLDDIQEQLSNHFAVDQNEDFELPDDPNVLIDSCWAAIYPSDNEWCRVKVIDLINPEEEEETSLTVVKEECEENIEDIRCRRILVKYIDYGTEEVLNIGDLKPLPIDVINIPAFAVRCRLSHISPPPDGWSDECLKYFEELSGIKIEQMVTVYVTERPSRNNYEQPLSVFLWYSDNALGQGKDILVNAALVKAHYAFTDSMDWVLEADAQSKEKTPPEINLDKITVAACSQIKSNSIDLHTIKHSSSLGAMEEIPDNWDPMTEDAKSYSNNYKFDPNDIGNVVQGFKSKDYTGICHQFLKGHCKFGAGCVHKHVTPEQVEALDSEEVLIETLERDIAREGLELNVTVTCCLSPYSFYVVPAEDIIHSRSYDSRVGRNYDFIDPTQKNLLTLMREMAEFYRKPENGENMMVFPAIGSLVAVRAEPYFRARVIDMSLDEDELTVMNIDTGVELIVERRDVFNLKPKFAALPEFAVHCAMEVPSGFCVTDEVMSKFSDLVLGQTFKAHFKERDMAGRFRVDLFHSEGHRVTI